MLVNWSGANKVLVPSLSPICEVNSNPIWSTLRLLASRLSRSLAPTSTPSPDHGSAASQPVSYRCRLARSRPNARHRPTQPATRLSISIAAIIGVTLLGVLLGPKSTYSGLESWQWVFVLSTFSLLIGEMFTGGFFVLPFGIGAASASALSFAEVEPPALIGVFTVVSALALWGLREFASKDDDVVFAVGGDRYVDQTGILTAPIQGVGTIGRVRIETESWMAITDGNQMIPEGAVVRVSEVRGTRMVVSAT